MNTFKKIVAAALSVATLAATSINASAYTLTDFNNAYLKLDHMTSKTNYPEISVSDLIGGKTIKLTTIDGRVSEGKKVLAIKGDPNKTEAENLRIMSEYIDDLKIVDKSGKAFVDVYNTTLFADSTGFGLGPNGYYCNYIISVGNKAYETKYDTFASVLSYTAKYDSWEVRLNVTIKNFTRVGTPTFRLAGFAPVSVEADYMNIDQFDGSPRTTYTLVFNIPMSTSARKLSAVTVDGLDVSFKAITLPKTTAAFVDKNLWNKLRHVSGSDPIDIDTPATYDTLYIIDEGRTIKLYMKKTSNPWATMAGDVIVKGKQYANLNGLIHGGYLNNLDVIKCYDIDNPGYCFRTFNYPGMSFDWWKSAIINRCGK